MTGLLNGVKTFISLTPIATISCWDMTGLLNGVKTLAQSHIRASDSGWDMTGLLNGVKTQYLPDVSEKISVGI